MCGGGEARGQFPDTKMKVAEVPGCLKDSEYLGIAGGCLHSASENPRRASDLERGPWFQESRGSSLCTTES